MWRLEQGVEMSEIGWEEVGKWECGHESFRVGRVYYREKNVSRSRSRIVIIKKHVSNLILLL